MQHVLFIINDAPYGSERDQDLMDGARRITMDALATTTLAADKVLVF